MRSALFPLACALTLAFSTAAQAQSVSFERLALFGGTAQALGASGDGAFVVGTGAPSEGGRTDAYRWVDGTVVNIGVASGSDVSFATDVSVDGRAVAGYASGATRDAFRWTADEGTQTLGTGEARAISDDGTVVVGTTTFGDSGVDAFRWTAESGMQPLGALPGDNIFSRANDIAASGDVIVGSISGATSNNQEAFRWTPTAGVVSLGVLQDDHQRSDAFGVSPDGQVVVGRSTGFGRPIKAFRWTAAQGMQDLGAPTNGSNPEARATSLNGEVIVGLASRFGVIEGTYWSAERGMQWLDEELAQRGLDVGGLTRLAPAAISADGLVIVGTGTDASGQRVAWRAILGSNFFVEAPAADEIVPPGETYTVRFSASGIDTVDLYLVTNSQDSNGTRTLLAEDVPVAGGTYAWEVDDDLLSPSTFLIAVNADDPDEEVVSERFRVRPPFRLVRVTGTVATPDYELAVTSQHVWTFEQSGANLWPEPYWERPERYYDGFPDFGADPFYAEPDVRYFPLGFPDLPYYWTTPWTAWVDAFGTDATYASLDPLGLAGFTALANQPDLGAFEAWRDALYPGYGQTIAAAADDSYKGVCFGLTNALLAAFGDADRFTGVWLPSLGGGNIAALGVTDEVRDVAHALQNRTSDERFARSRDNQQVFDPATPRSVLERIKAMLARDVRDLDRVVWFSGQTTDTDESGDPVWAAHAVAPLGLEDEGVFGNVDAGEPGDGRYALVFFDPNVGGAAVMPIDSTANAWGPYDFWLGGTGAGLFVGPEVLDVYDVGNPPWLQDTRAAQSRTGDPDLVSVHVAGRSSAVVASNGDRIAFERGVLTETLGPAYARFPITGVPGRPESYRVPRGAYRAEVTPDEGGFARLSVDWGRLRLGVERTDGLPTDGLPEARDALAVDPAGTAMLTSAGGEVMLRALTTVGDGETRLFVADSLAVGTGTEARLAMTADSAAFALGGLAGAATYDLTLAVSSAPGSAEAGTRSFYSADVALPAGATHTVRPVWSTLGDAEVMVEVDLDGDGDTDETLLLPNEGLPVASEEEANALPNAFALAAYPNPTLGAATVAVALPEATDVRAEVFDLLGRRVAVLHEGVLAAGAHPLRLDTARLPAGVYVVRAVTPAATLTQRITVVR
ncbi:MAG: Ser-Thr-rich GPI-anchored membrane family protein [Bacteroidota bacterium]